MLELFDTILDFLFSEDPNLSEEPGSAAEKLFDFEYDPKPPVFRAATLLAEETLAAILREKFDL